MSDKKEIIVKPLKQKDFEAWLPLWKGYQVFYKADIADDVTKETWARFHKRSEPMYALGAFMGGQLVGFTHYIYHRSCWVTDDYCYLQDLFADNSVRGKGVGRALIEAVYKAADEYGANRVYWLTQDDNKTARLLYDRIAGHTGFVQYKKML